MLEYKYCFQMLLMSPSLKSCIRTSTARPAAPHITSSPGPNTTVLSTLNSNHENLTTEQLTLDRATAPAGKLNETAPLKERTAEFSTTKSSPTQMETHSFDLHTDETSKSQSGNLSSNNITFINTTYTSFSDFLNETTDASSERGFNESSEASFLRADPPDQEYQQFNTMDKEELKGLKWMWGK